jgi:hypothetical protein
VIGPLQPAEFALLASRDDFSWSSLATGNLWATDSAACDSATEAALLAAVSDEERAAIELLLAHWGQDDLDLLAAPE